MGQFDQGVPEDLERIAQRLRSERPGAGALELDAVKTRALAQATSSRRKGPQLRTRRSLVALVTVALMAGGTGGVIAASGGGKSSNSAGNSQYKPGKGCGDKNHVHARENECKKPPK